ncbi:hypothetical protein Tco_0739141 [Tanacetum coccineum]
MTMSKLPSLIGMRSILKVASSVIGRILSIKARDMDTKLLLAPKSNNTLARRWFRRNVPVASSGWPFVSAVPGQMTYLVASLTLNSASISPEGFLSSILLLVVIIVAVVIMVILVVVVVEGWANEFHQDKASSVRVPVENFTLLSSVQLLQENTD